MTMLEHLDDPNPPQANADTRRLVLRRASRIRRQRALTAGLCLVALLAGALGGLAVGRGQGTTILTTTQSAYEFDHESTTLTGGVAVPTAALVDVTFVDAQDGYGIALHRSKLVLASTSDGGSTWRVVAPKFPAGFLQGAGFAGQMEFSSAQHGYLWGGNLLSAKGDSPLWVTNNGGRTWQRAALGPLVYDVSAIGDNVWAMAGTCRADTLPSICAVTVDISTDGGTVWQAESEPAPLQSPATMAPYELARISLQHAYVLAPSAGPSPFVLLFSADAGATWITRPVPCPTPFSLGAELAASSSEDLWLICGGQATSGDQLKELYRSDDGGQTWNLASSATGFFGGAPDTTLSTAPLSASGYVAPFSIGHKTLAVVSPTQAWLFPSRGNLLMTTDGGYEWKAVPDLKSVGLNDGGAGNVTFISDTQGWVCAYGIGLWHTDDGIHWSALGQ
jgi:photosystem II stability/assembly factor-like uncharacterized protein